MCHMSQGVGVVGIVAQGRGYAVGWLVGLFAVHGLVSHGKPVIVGGSMQGK